MTPTDTPQPGTGRLMHWISRHAAGVVSVFVLITAALAIPLLTMAPDEMASQEPPGEVFDARDTLEDRFGGDAESWAFIAEAADGNVLDRDTLLAVAGRADALRAAPELASTLVEHTDEVTGAKVTGMSSFADTVDATLARSGDVGLAAADDEAVRAAVDELLDTHDTGTLGVSQEAEHTGGHWSAPALLVTVLGTDEGLTRSEDGSGFGSDIAVEERGRDILAVLDGDETLEVNGIALDQNLTAQEQGAAAGPFIGFTVLVIVLMVGVAFRSYWALAVVGGALVSLLVWLIGLANLVGLKEDQILSTVVPIAMIAFGVDYAFHAIGRYREERATGLAQRPALARGLHKVVPALVLALTTGVVAFLANTASNVESIVQFGIASAIALVSAFLVLGIAVPAALAVIEERVGSGRPGKARRIAALGGATAAAGGAMTAVLFLVFLAPPVGLAILAGYAVVFVAVPAWLAGRRRPAAPDRAKDTAREGRLTGGLARGVVAVAARRFVVLPVVLVLSAGAAVFAMGVPASFDVEDFFAEDTDFVVGLDKLDEHVGSQNGEQATVLVTADVDDPGVVAELDRFAGRLAGSDIAALARNGDGEVRVDRASLDALAGDRELAPAERAQVITDPDAQGRTALQLSVGIVGSRAQENVEAARDQLEPLVDELDTALATRDSGAGATLTGAPIVRQASMDAVLRSLQISLPIAVVLCLVTAWIFLRSWRYALVSIVPILLVVAWLYGFMNLAGFSVNLVTATIGAISIGIGIDFAIHLTVRYRDELRTALSRAAALRAAVAGTGTALAGSALSSAAGFVILAFAPMPMFASFGLLTAVMIVLALLSCLVVLPGLLMLVSKEPAADGSERAPVLAAAAP